MALLLGVIALFGLACAGEPAGSGGRRATGPAFVDRTEEWGLDFVHFNGMSGEMYFSEVVGAGAALLDYDNDGDLDLYLVQGTVIGPGKTIDDALFPPRHELPLTDRLYRNDLVVTDRGQEAQFVDVTSTAGIEALGYGMGVTTGDVDNDGWTDLYVTNLESNQLWHNNGDGTFSDVTATAGADDGRWSTSAAFLDYDADGWLDLFVTNYVNYHPRHHKPCMNARGAPNYCGPQGFASTPDRLFRNRGDGTFEDVSWPAGIAGEPGSGLGVVAADFDGDERIDIYVANDLMHNHLWRNRGDGTFVNDALLAGCAVDTDGKAQASMGVDAADFDADGDLDLYMTHLAHDTNTLYWNDGDGIFRDGTRSSHLGEPSFERTGFGTVALDWDGDGWVDLFSANGAVRSIDDLREADDPFPLHEPNQLYRNLGEGRFEDVSASVPALARSQVSRGATAGDLDNDGDPDLVITNNNGTARLLVNESGTGEWLGLRVLGTSGRRHLLGTQVTIETAAGRPLVRRVATDASYCSARDPRLAIGIGNGRATQVTINTPTGGTIRWLDPPAGRLATFAETPP